MPKRVTGNIKWCHICGLYIPDCIVSPDHPLFGTIDHVVPRSTGGKDIRRNRKPAHRWCNARKGSSTEPFAVEYVCNLQGFILTHLRKVRKQYATDRKLSEARARIGLRIPTKEERRIHSDAGSWHIHVWEQEGGAVVNQGY